MLRVGQTDDPYFEHTFAYVVSAQRHLVVGELQDVQDLSLAYGQLLLLGPLDLSVGVHHHGVQHLYWPYKLGEEQQRTVSVSLSDKGAGRGSVYVGG